MAYSTSIPLNQQEAYRLYNELKKRGFDVRLRELNDYSPDDISETVGMKAKEIAKMAGRKDEERAAPIA